jgi:HemK-like putative methylase
LVSRRGKGEPLQYILGSQPFGGLDIKCRKGVLIPRQCTEEYTETLAEVIRHAPQLEQLRGGSVTGSTLRILDLCTGTGCIPLLLASMLQRQFSQVEVKGVDIASTALSLSRQNVRYNADLLPKSGITFQKADVLSLAENSELGEWDIVTANPPYISTYGFNTFTERSVRNYEPKLALVPDTPSSQTQDTKPEDVFYPAIIATALKAKATFLLMEVAGTEQALRVARMAADAQPDAVVEIWRDGLVGMGVVEAVVRDMRSTGAGPRVGKYSFQFRGEGEGRSVFVRFLCKA